MALPEREDVIHRNVKPTSSKVLDLLDGGELPIDFIKHWNRLSSDQQKTFKDNYLQRHVSLFDAGTVQVFAGDEQPGVSGEANLSWKKTGPFALMAPEMANTVTWVGNKDNRDKQIEAVLEGIGFIHNRNLPRGLNLTKDKAMQTPVTTKQEVEGCGKMADVLGKGNSAGEITVFKDTRSGRDMALKTVMISQFNPNEIRLWIQLGDGSLAPELYQFELSGNKLYFTMEILSGKDLQDVIDEDMWNIPDSALARDFSLCILHDLLDIWEKMRFKHFVHGDMHAGNLRLEKSMNVKIFDFGRARSLLNEKKVDGDRLVKGDIVGIIRVFCALYSGFDFNDGFDAIKILEAKNLKELDDSMIRISEENRKELYHIMTMLFDTVRADVHKTQSGTFGDTKGVTTYVKSLLSSTDMTEIKKKVAVLIFTKRFRNKVESEPVSDSELCETDSVDGRPPIKGRDPNPDLDSIWDDPDMDNFICNVSDADLKELGAF